MTRAVGLFFRDDGEDVDDAGARSLLAALHDAHVAFTLECAAVLEMNKFGTCFADALRAASRGMTQAVCNAMSSASAEAGDGRSAATKRAVVRFGRALRRSRRCRKVLQRLWLANSCAWRRS